VVVILIVLAIDKVSSLEKNTTATALLEEAVIRLLKNEWINTCYVVK
jgi:hypothetical protein